jgi:hypothetical protein
MYVSGDRAYAPISTESDDATIALLNNSEALAPNWCGTNVSEVAHAAVTGVRIWASTPKAPTGSDIDNDEAAECKYNDPGDRFVAVFNTNDTRAHTASVQLSALGLGAKSSCAVRDLWANTDAGASGPKLNVQLGPQESRLFIFHDCL